MLGLCPVVSSAFGRNGETECRGVCVQLHIMARVGS